MGFKTDYLPQNEAYCIERFEWCAGRALELSSTHDRAQAYTGIAMAYAELLKALK